MAGQWFYAGRTWDWQPTYAELADVAREIGRLKDTAMYERLGGFLKEAMQSGRETVG